MRHETSKATQLSFVPIQPPDYLIAWEAALQRYRRFIAEYYVIPAEFFYRDKARFSKAEGMCSSYGTHGEEMR